MLYIHHILHIQEGRDTKDVCCCGSLSAKEPLIIGLFCGKWPALGWERLLRVSFCKRATQYRAVMVEHIAFSRMLYIESKNICKRAQLFAALLQKETRILRHPMHLRHLYIHSIVSYTYHDAASHFDVMCRIQKCIPEGILCIFKMFAKEGCKWIWMYANKCCKYTQRRHSMHHRMPSIQDVMDRIWCISVICRVWCTHTHTHTHSLDRKSVV